MDARVEPGVSRTETEARSTVNFDFVGDHSAVRVAHGFDFGDGKSAIAQIRQSAPQSLVEFVLQGGRLLGRGEDASVNAVLLLMAVGGKKHELDLIGRGGHTNLWLVAKPAARREQDKH